MSRSRRERRDSVDASVLAERAAWAARLEASPPETPEESQRELNDEKRFKKAGLGVRRAGKRGVFRREGIEAARVGSQRCGGAPPPLKHALPEVLLVGAANAGKSTLINALVGAAPASKAAPASASDRAGWTSGLEWIRVGAKPPLLYVVDAPGYGAHAVATARERREWTTLCADYARTRATLAAAVVVVDATRGVSPEDRRWLDLLAAAPTVVALSKCDLLKGPGAVARCARLVEADANCDVVATCGTTGAGVGELWAKLRARCAAVSVRTSDPRAVAVHRSAVEV